MLIRNMPYEEYISTENDYNISLHFFNEAGANSITIKQGNIKDKEKMVNVATDTIKSGVGKIIQIEGHLTKYLYIAITGDGNLEMDGHSKRNPN